MSAFVSGLYGTHLAKPARRRRRVRWSALAAPVAAGVGHTLRLGRVVVTHAPGVAGPLLVSLGAWLAWAPAGFAVLGGFLLLLDRRLSA